MSDAEADNTATVDQALAMLPDDEEIHTFMQAGFTLIGADWDRKELIELIERAWVRKLTGANARAMGHGLAVPHADTWLFIATREAACTTPPTGNEHGN